MMRKIFLAVSILVVLVLSGCDDFNLFDLVDSELEIKPEMAALGVGESLTFEAARGVPPYVFQLSDGSGVVDEHTGEYVAGGPDDALILVTDSSGKTAVASVFVVEPFSASPEAATIEISADLTITVTGGRAPYVFSIQGTPLNTFDNLDTVFTTPGTSCVYQGNFAGNDIIQVEDDLGSTDSLQIAVVPSGGPLYLTPESAQVEIDGTVSFSVGGGVAPYSIAAVSGAVAPTVMASAGTFIYTAPGTDGSDTVTVTDSNLDEATADLTILAEALKLIPSETITLYVGEDFIFAARGGLPPHVFAIDPEDAGDAAIDAVTGLFTAVAKNNSVIVLLTDAAEGSDQCRVKVKN